MTPKSKSQTEYLVHPSAEAFAMMSNDELSDLAADIQANGLNHPIMLDSEGKVIIDGRNRLKACEMAGIEPRFDRLNGQNPDVYILSENARRRHSKNDQIIMAQAIIHPEPGPKLGRGKKGESVLLQDTLGLSRSRTLTLLAQARQLLSFKDQHDRLLYPDLVEDVKYGSKTIGEALKLANDRQLASQSDQEILEELRREASELFSQVPEKMTLRVAWAAYQEKLAEESELQKIRCESAHKLVTETAHHLWTLGTGTVTRDEFPLVLEDDEFLKAIDGHVMGYGLGLIWEHVDEDALRAGVDHLISMIRIIKDKKYGQTAHAD